MKLIFYHRMERESVFSFQYKNLIKTVNMYFALSFSKWNWSNCL